MKFCSASRPFLYASFTLVVNGNIYTTQLLAASGPVNQTSILYSQAQEHIRKLLIRSLSNLVIVRITKIFGQINPATSVEL